MSKYDIHTRLMGAYEEVPEWQYLMFVNDLYYPPNTYDCRSVLIVSIGLGAAGVGAWPTSTTPAVVLYGVFLAVRSIPNYGESYLSSIR